MTADRVVVDGVVLQQLVAAAIAYMARTRVPDLDLRAAIAALVGSSRPAPPQPRPLVSVAEAVELTGLSESTVRRRIRDGTLPHRRLGGRVLIPRAHLVTAGHGRSGPVTGVADGCSVADAEGDAGGHTWM